MASLPSKPYFILFGATGDLAREKIYPALKQVKNITVIGYGRDPSPGTSINGYPYVVGDFENPANLESFLGKLLYQPTKIKHYEDKYKKDSSKKLTLFFYFALPPTLYISAIKFVKKNFQSFKTKIALEKPFGTSLSDAKKLAQVMKKYNLSDFYLVDHYLAKESIQKAFSKKVDLRGIKRMEVSILETADVSKRGKFYEQIGVIKDIGQNHILNIIDLFFRKNKVNDFWQKVKYQNGSLLLGQYRGYRQVLGVDRSSNTPTYFKADIIYKDILITLRSGKALNQAKTAFDIFDKESKKKVLIKSTVRQSAFEAHKAVITDFINQDMKYSIKVSSAILSWKIIKRVYQDSNFNKLVLYHPGSTPNKIEKN